MKTDLNIFFKKKILIYGLGKSGLSTFNFLKKKNNIFLYDDFKKNIKKNISYKTILKTNFDYIIIGAWNYFDFIKKKLRYVKRWNGKIVTFFPDYKLIK